ncbi:hypothetical protein QAD02_002302 [Eretmocerus hayati]|uniref:Uncharacterized protein n=1 Tax=Eretmocerus hayati TaxID=131215 RepID=A0ACC2NJQ7_9HYME|nr:hypothetical protein QAD02_002302 [Eretmocerus hayati]
MTPNRAPLTCRTPIANPSTSYLAADVSGCNLTPAPISAEILAFSTTLTQLDTSRLIPDAIPSTSFLGGIFQVSTPSNNPLHSETNGDTDDTLGIDIDKQSREGLAHPVPMLVELTSPMEQESSNQDHEFDGSELGIMEDPLAQDDSDTTSVCDSGATKRGPFNAEEIRLKRKREMNRLRQERLRKREPEKNSKTTLKVNRAIYAGSYTLSTPPNGRHALVAEKFLPDGSALQNWV